MPYMFGTGRPCCIWLSIVMVSLYSCWICSSFWSSNGFISVYNVSRHIMTVYQSLVYLASYSFLRVASILYIFSAPPCILASSPSAYCRGYSILVF